jgi:BirA family biotin operon repressor/biotin-[acetyl-CoA-carboxylase] ligase
VVAGIGINVRQRARDFPPGVRDQATSLEMVAGGRVSRAALAGRVLGELRSVLGRPTLRLDGAVGADVRARDVLVGRSVTVTGGLRGVARGIDHDGALLLDEEGGERRRVFAGSVRIADDATLEP